MIEGAVDLLHACFDSRCITNSLFNILIALGDAFVKFGHIHFILLSESFDI